MPTELAPKWACMKSRPKSVLSSAPSKRRNLAKSARFASLVRCQEVVRQELVEKLCATLSHPLEVETVRFEKAMVFSARCYKVVTTTSTNEEMPAMVTAMFDTGDGPNLVRKDVLSTPWLVNVQPIRVSVKAASDTAF